MTNGENSLSPDIYIADLAERAETAGVSRGAHRKGHWLAIPYEAGEVAGTMLWTGPETQPAPVRIALGQTGWHGLYVGLWSLENETDNGVRVKLAGDPCYTFLRRERPGPFHFDERFWKYADLTGQDLVLAASAGVPRQGALAYIRLAPLTEGQLAQAQAEQRRSDTKRLLAMNDGFSDFCVYHPTSVADIWEWLEPYRGTDFKAILWCIGRGDVCTYDTKVGALQYEGIEDYPRILDRYAGESLHALVREQGVDPLATALAYAHRIGLELHASYRMNAFGWAEPFTEVYSGRLYRQHPEWYCVDRDGTPVARLSYAYPQVQEFVLALIKEALGYGVDGVNLIFPRSGPFVLYEPPVRDGFLRQYGADPCSLPEDDGRWLAYRAGVMTGFMRALRKLVDRVAVATHRGRLPISVHVHNRKAVDDFYGLDVAAWVQEGLIDTVIPYPWEENDPALIDMEHYRRAIAGSACRLYPDFFPAGMKVANYDYLSAAQAFYSAGADGLCMWDVNTVHSDVEPWPLLKRLGHKDDLAAWRQQFPFPGSRRVLLRSLDGKSLTHHPPHWSYCYRYRWPDPPHPPREFHFRKPWENQPIHAEAIR